MGALILDLGIQIIDVRAQVLDLGAQITDEGAQALNLGSQIIDLCAQFFGHSDNIHSENVYVVFQQSDPQRRWSQNLCFEARLSSVWLGPWAGLVSGRPMGQQPKFVIISDLAAAVPQLKSHIHTCMFTSSKIAFGRKLCAHCKLFGERCKVLPLTPLSIR